MRPRWHNEIGDRRKTVTCPRTLYAHIGLTVSDLNQNDDRLDLAHLSEISIEALTIDQLTALLDTAREYGKPLVENSNHSAKAQVADLVRLGGLRALTLNPEMEPADIWRRLHWVDHHQGYKRETTNALIEWFGARPTVRSGIQTHVVFDAGYEHVRDATFAFYECGLGLYPDVDDVIALIEEFDRRRGDAAADLEMLEELVLLAPRRDGIVATVTEAAAKIGADSPAFLARLEELSKPLVYEWEEKETAAKKEREARRAAIHQTFRDSIAKDLLAVNAGAPNLLYDPAKAYLGRFSDFDREAPPQTRVTDFLGEDLGERALSCLARWRSAATLISSRLNGSTAGCSPKRTLTNLYNARPQWLANAHAALDAAVADAYGWAEDWRAGQLDEDEILARLFALNQSRSTETS